MSKLSQDVFHRLPEETLRKVILESKSIRDVFYRMELCISGTHYTSFKRRISELNIDISHFNGIYKGGKHTCELPVERVFAAGTRHNGPTLARKIRKYSLKPYQCTKCGLVGEWQNELITLQIDHINGTSDDNRLENLRFLCPNCHSQTPTYAGKRFKKHYHCVECGRPRSSKARLCRVCDNRRSTRTLTRYVKHVNWPDLDVLARRLWETPMSKIAKECGGSLGGLRKHCAKYNISCPSHGYWQRRAHGYTHEESLVSQTPVHAPQRLMSKIDIEEAAEMLRNGKSLREIADKIGFAHSSVMRALRRNGFAIKSTAKRGRHRKLVEVA